MKNDSFDCVHLAIFTIFSSFAGGFFKKYISGAYARHRMATIVSMTGKPTPLTMKPLIAGP
jgi:hypothetical protein